MKTRRRSNFAQRTRITPTLLASCLVVLLTATAERVDAGFLYGINLGANPNADTENLYRVDLSDNSVTSVGPDNDVFQGIQSLAFNRNTNELYGYDIVNDDLVVINPNTGAITNTIDINFIDFPHNNNGSSDNHINVFSLGFDPTTNTLWAVNGFANAPGNQQQLGDHLPGRSLVKIDTTTGETVTIGDGFDTNDNIVSIDYDSNSNTLYGVSINNDDFFRINTTTGELELITSLSTASFNASLGLGYDYDNDVLYGFEDNPDQIITINTTTGALAATGITFPNGTNIRGLTYAGTLNEAPEQIIPEPSSIVIALFACGGIALIIRRSRR